MKRQALSLISLLSLLLMAGSAIAQTIHVRANVPFNFSVGNKTLPAGAYTIETISPDAKMLLLRARVGKPSMMVGSNTAEALKGAEKNKLVFNHYGSQYFLSEIRIEGSDVSYKLPKSRAEVELRAQNASASQMTLLASLK